MGIAHDYLDAVLRRGRTEMPPVGFRPDWADKPRAGKYYPGTTPLPLPHGDDPPAATLDAGLAPPPPGGGAPFGLDALAGMLLDSYGRLSRRLALHANDDVAALPHYTGASWARGTASGGGLYPVSIYWVNGPGTALLPGVHYYDTAQHAFRRLLAGDVTGHVREALGPRTPPDDDPGQQFLVLGIKFWQNAFKYNSFCYHATAMDVGTLTQTWRMWARARGMAVRPVFWFDERRLARLLGIDPADEAVAAVVPLRTGPATRPSPATGTPRVRLADRERSRRVRTFAAVREMQAAALAGASSRPRRTRSPQPRPARRGRQAGRGRPAGPRAPDRDRARCPARPAQQLRPVHVGAAPAAGPARRRPEGRRGRRRTAL
ncbi:SagB family peptide dehydrogenase [Streptomyces eurocidicus]|uniref:SagB family peptide dehydrogenase n=1 Tax=Streptomyces eurocidicus TaxID=66423 RepID=UPI002680CBCF